VADHRITEAPDDLAEILEEAQLEAEKVVAN
jgi:hypothetical protein